MRAMVYARYGAPGNLRLADVPMPSVGDGEVLVRVHAASINSWDGDLLRGTPYLARLGSGMWRPKKAILGCDIAGRVEAAGAGVTDFVPGDAVFGDISGCGFGGFSEYVSVRASVLALLPEGLPFEQAAAIPQAGVLALQALRTAEPLDGKHIMINGAGGGVGTLALQMLRPRAGAITAVDRADKLGLLRSLGADQVIDYQGEDFSRSGQSYDAIVDVVMRRPLGAYRRALADGGRFILIGGATTRIAQTVLFGPLYGRRDGKRYRLLIHRVNREDLAAVGEMVASGQVKPIIDRTFPLERLPEAFERFIAGDAHGKIVVSIAE